LCKVLESRQGGLAHYTNLEFVDRDPKFWDVPAEQPVAARQTPEIQEIESGGSSPVATPRMEPSSRPGGDIHKGALAQAKSGKLNELSTEEIIPAKILSQSLPSIPPWAKGLDMDGIVQLDALIDENGNVAEVKPMSGPRLLQRAAERAVALWIFQPALSAGKPTATHIVLTVQFQR
jgi:protein TonB